MMDIFSECAFVGYDNSAVYDTNVDLILKDNKWHNNKGTGYARILWFYNFDDSSIFK